jgi:hypothetical protein
VLDIVFRALQGFAVVFMIGGVVVILWQLARPVIPSSLSGILPIPVSAPGPSY